MVNRSLGWESFKAVLWSFSGMAFSLFNGVLAARLLVPEDRGVLALALTLSGVAHLFSSVGTNISVRTFQPAHEWASFRTYFSLVSRLIFLNLFLILCLLSLFIFLERLSFSVELLAVVVLSLAIFVCNQLLDVLNAAGRVSLSSFVNSIGHAVTMSGLLIIYVAELPGGALGAVFAYSAGFVFRSVFVVFSFRALKISFGTLSADRGARLLKSGVRFWGVNIGQTMTFRADQLLLGALAGAHSVGIYSVAVAPAALMHVVSSSIGQVLFRQAAVRSLTVRSYIMAQSAALGVTVTYVVFMWFASPLLIPLFFGVEYEASVAVVRTLLIGELALSFYLVIVRVISGYNYPLVASWSGVIGLIVMVSLMFYLVPQLGAVGAAVSAVVSYFAMAIWVGVFFVRILRNEVSNGRSPVVLEPVVK